MKPMQACSVDYLDNLITEIYNPSGIAQASQEVSHVEYGGSNYSRPFIIQIAFLGVVQISESFGLVNVYIFNGAYSIFYLMHHKILMYTIKYGNRI